MTSHKTVLAHGADGLFQARQAGDNVIDISGAGVADGEEIKSGALSGFRCVKQGDAFSFEKDGHFLSAAPDRVSTTVDRHSIGPWETFYSISAEDCGNLDTVDPSIRSEVRRFRTRIAELAQAGLPVKIYFGCGHVPMHGYLNVDIVNMAPQFSTLHPESYFVFPYIGCRIDVADDVCDYIFHEDLIEHVDQLSQIMFLAEARRIMKPNSWHRVNTPSLLNTMKINSDFSKGSDGVYTGERQWGHVALFTHAYLAEIAYLVGYREVVFNGKGGGVSPFATPDRRPGSDRDEIVGNIYADLLK